MERRRARVDAELAHHLPDAALVFTGKRRDDATLIHADAVGADREGVTPEQVFRVVEDAHRADREQTGVSVERRQRLIEVRPREDPEHPLPNDMQPFLHRRMRGEARVWGGELEPLPRR